MRYNQVPDIDFDLYMQERQAEGAHVKRAEEYRESVLRRFHGDDEMYGDDTPWNRLHGNFAFRPGEVTVWVGFNGHKKSMILGYVCLNFLAHGKRCCIASFEMKPTATVARMAKQAIGTGDPSIEYLDKFFYLAQNLWLYDQQGTVGWGRVLNVIYYCADQLKINHFVVDSLMKCVKGEEDYDGQKNFVDALCAAARDLNIHIHLVHHSRKREDENIRPGKQDAKGTGSIVDQADNFIVVYKIPEKAKQKEPDLPDIMLYIDKQRNGEWEGKTGLWFNQGSLQFSDTKDSYPVYFVK